MASPMTHGLIGMGALGGLLVLVVLSLFSRPNIWEYVSVFIWTVGFDFVDPFFSKSYLKDLWNRIFERGGGPPAEHVKLMVPWFHVLPGLVSVWIYSIGLYIVVIFVFNSSFRIWLPFVFWALHVLVDHFQRDTKQYSPFYPLHKKTWRTKKGYPIKPPAEFIFNSFIWMMISFVLLGLLLF